VNRLRLADLFTLGNLVAGCLSILAGDPLTAAAFIVLGAFLDLFDGMVARWMNQASSLGVQLDSLADMVTFGVAPALLLYRMMPQEPWILAIILLIPACSAWRLAVFNLLPPSPVFLGLPTPANALWYAALSLWLPEAALAPTWLQHPTLHLLIVLGLSLWMVSRLEVPSFKKPEIFWQRPLPLILALTAIIAAVVTGYPYLAPSGAMAGAMTGIIGGNILLAISKK
jgi:CDP-diacylglycerol---serine O-phosphatidyltransferase